MAVQTYNVPVVLPDLRKEESILQVVDALEYLDAVANDIFNRISFRVAENRDQLMSINNRINVAQAKIDKIRNSSSKATRVFASPKYPAKERLDNYLSMFNGVDPRLQKVRKNRTAITSRIQEVNREILKQKRKPRKFAVKGKREKFREGVVMDDPEHLGEGLGSLPRRLPSVSSLLLFNTCENPYRKYVLLDPLSGAKVKTRDKVIEEDELTEAPTSILKGEELERGPQDSNIYQPVMAELPELDVPVSLPFLPHIADDVEYTADLGPSIAPSLANTSVPELPNLAGSSAPATNEPPPPPPPAGGSIVEPPAPPPPPPPPSAAAEPPPPHAMEDDSDEDESQGAPSATVEGVPSQDSGRANLMEAIRKAGGAGKAGLKNAKNRKKQRKAKKEEAAVSSGGDLLNDLSAALGRRRKAISGRDKAPNTGGGSMMDKVAAMIPPPSALPGGGEEDNDSNDGGGDW